MQTATTQRAAKARTKAPKACAFPELPEFGRDFALAILLREQAMLEAISAHTWKCDFQNKPKPYRLGIVTGIMALENKVDSALKRVIKDGLLPFAHAHTTYFDQQVAV